MKTTFVIASQKSKYDKKKQLEVQRMKCAAVLNLMHIHKAEIVRQKEALQICYNHQKRSALYALHLSFNVSETVEKERCEKAVRAFFCVVV